MWVRQVVTGLPFVVLGFVALGALTSVAFNNTLGRGDYANESIGVWAKWGLKSNVLPLFLLIVGYLVPLAGVSIWRLLTRFWGRAARLDSGDDRAHEARRPRSGRPRFDPRPGLDGQPARRVGALLGSADTGMSTSLNYGPAEALQILSPAFESGARSRIGSCSAS